ncbi:zinc ABC transporter substrate-binding protein ZnuA [Allorhizobium undicola]|uniref:zinc ABC transporter substrate-binding protein ZnuA n=1 Tax=Allorhizobium undicola TaxID=78527 RepID=UPI0004867763|nr:zinc ABC transporter substrate-binding protein ZnuA [Allorhizobium undicola]
MKTLKHTLLASLLCLVTPALGVAAPKVVASVKPVHSIVAAIMEGAGSPDLLVEGAGSPHAYSLKPSKARQLEKADLVFWVGPGLESFLEKPLDALSGHAEVVELSTAQGVIRLPLREGGAFDAHDHDHEGGDHKDHAGAHGHDEHAHQDAHEHEGMDMHLWLDPDNARAIARTVAAKLAAKDPANAALYDKNLKGFEQRMDALDSELKTSLGPVKDKPFIVFHDAYQYFEHHYQVAVAGSITVSPDVAPGAERVAQVHGKVKSLSAACIFAEPQFPPKLIAVVAEGTDARTGTLDPLGADIKDGPDLYPTLMRNLAANLVKCLGQG